MAYALRFDGSNQFAMTSIVGTGESSIAPTSGTYRVILPYLRYYGGQVGYILSHSYPGLSIRVRNTSGSLQVSPGLPLGGGIPSDGTPCKVEVVWDIDASTVTVYVDDLPIETLTGVDCTFTNTSHQRTVFVRDVRYNKEWAEIDIGGVVTIWEDTNNFGFTYDFSTSGPDGAYLLDTTNGVDAELRNFSGDNSYWVYYDDGGTGGGTLYEIALASSETLTDAVTLNVGETFTNIILPAEQRTQGSTVATQIAQSIAAIVGSQSEESSTFDVYLDGVLNSLTAEQVSQTNVTTVQQSIDVSGLLAYQYTDAVAAQVATTQLTEVSQAEQYQQAQALTPTQSGGQSVILLTAAQVEQGSVLTSVQQQTLAGIVAQQLSQAGVDPTLTYSAITLVNAEHLSEAQTLSLEGTNGMQYVTLVTAEHAENAQAVFVSEVSASALLTAENVTEASSVSVDAVLSTISLPAQQLTQANRLKIMSHYVAPPEGIELIPVTPTYTLTLIPNPTYTIEEI